MRAFWRDFGFTLSIFFAVVTAAVFAFVFSASPQLVIALLVLGLFTAVAERSCVPGHHKSLLTKSLLTQWSVVNITIG